METAGEHAQTAHEGPGRAQQHLYRLLPELNFFRYHVVLGIFVPLVTAAIMYGSNKAFFIPYTDALFMTTSAMSGCGLSTIEVSSMTRWQQVILYILFQCFSVPSVSVITLVLRRIRFAAYLRTEHPHHLEQETDTNGIAGAGEGGGSSKKPEQLLPEREQDTSKNGKDSSHASRFDRRHQYQSQSHMTGLGGFPNPFANAITRTLAGVRKRTMRKSLAMEDSKADEEGGQRRSTYLPADVDVRRNSRFCNVDAYRHREIGELELRSMDLLIALFFAYLILLQLIAVTILAPDLAAGHFVDQFRDAYATSTTWFAFFQAGSFLHQSGFSLIDSSLTGFLRDYCMLIPGLFLMLAGNLLLPVCMRILLWLLQMVTHPGRPLASTIAFVRDHPRRVTYLIWPPFETYILAFVVLLLTVVDWAFFYILDVGNSSIYEIPLAPRILAGLVQATAVRSAGFYVRNLSLEAPSLHVLYMFMMAFGVYPLAMGIRSTNVYEERALGLSEEDEHGTTEQGLRHLQQEKSYVGLHLREQLAYDVWVLILAVWLICIIERHNLTLGGPAQSLGVFGIIFEAVSAYATVGLSLGLPYSNTSLAASFNTLSKLILIALMIRGRTRGLPLAQDRAVMTPAQLKRHGDPPEMESGDKGQHISEVARQNP